MLVPKFDNVEAILDFCSKLDGLSDPVTLDFSDLGFSRPKGMVLAAAACRSLKKNGLLNGITGDECNSYVVNMGFYESFGFQRRTAKALGNERYIPLQNLTVAEVQQEAEKFSENQGETVQRWSGKMAHLLTQDFTSEQYKLIKYALREVARNVVEHSGSDAIFIAGQYWPATREVELVIYDEGVGLKKGLSTNPHLSIEDDYQAIKYALVPGISGKRYEGSVVERKTEWTNSGFGLYMTSQIARNFGEFSIASGDTYLSLLGKVKKPSKTFCLPGTFVSMTIDVGKLSRTAPLLAVYTKRGEEMAARMKHGGEINASAASKFLME